MVSLDQFRDSFLTECDELLVEMESQLVDLDPDSADTDSLNAIFRCAHSIKGGSGAFGLTFITNFTHILEALLDAMREGRVPPSRAAVDSLLRAVDVVVQMVAAAKAGETPPESLGADMMVELQRLADNNTGADASSEDSSWGLFDDETLSQAEEQSSLWLIKFIAHETLFSSGNEPILILRELAGLGKTKVKVDTTRVPPLDELNPTACFLGWSIELETTKSEADIREVFEFVEDQCDLSIVKLELANTPVRAEVASAQPANVAISSVVSVDKKPEPADAEKAPFMRRSSDNLAAATIRVDLDKVDRLVNMVGELVITEAMIKAQTKDLPTERFEGLLRGVDELSQHTRELQEAVMSVRMQPVKSIFARMPRIVRDLSAQLGKEINLETLGENTEVDKTVVEQLGDPLTHMIRNSVDHGVEKPEVRIAAGKPAQGTIILAAYHQGGRIIIEIRDDGAGINRAKVLAKAKEKGLFPADAVLSDDECDNLIFMAGFSTADVVSNVSGRGVGMDVVRRNIEGLDGRVSVKSEQGKGSVFTVSLPLTLAILDGMIVRVGIERYIVPITSIIETLRPKPDDVRHLEAHGDVINVRGEFVPLIYLHQVFNIKNAEQDPRKALVVLVESGKDKLGLVVDELIGQQQVVIKSLEDNTDPVLGVSGATILGDGHVSLILEISELKQLGHKENNSSMVRVVAA